MTAPQVATDLTVDAARALVDSMRAEVANLSEQIVTAYKGRAWVALGYPTWDEMCAAEFAGARLRIPREDRAEQVQSLRAEGLSTRTIGAALGITEGTVRNDIKAGAKDYAPATPVTGQDGKTYAPTRPAVAKVTETTKTETYVDTATGEVVAGVSTATDAPVLTPAQWASTPTEHVVVERAEPTNAELDQQLAQALGADHQFLSNLIAASDPAFLRLPPHRVIETYRPGSDDAGAVDNFLARLDTWLSTVQAGVRRAHLRSVR